MNDTLTKIKQAPIVPTVLPMPAEILRGYIRVLSEENYPAIEILCRPADDALSLISAISGAPERQMIRIGIGTILTEDIALQAVSLKPDFLVSPAFSRRVLRVAAEAGVPYIPGVRSFQDVQDVLDAFQEFGLGVEVLKLCPVHGLDADYVRMLRGCYPGISFCPTGSSELESMESYSYWKSQPGIVAPMGRTFVPPALLERGDFDAVRERLREIRLKSLEVCEV